jgi:hypothetical protein
MIMFTHRGNTASEWLGQAEMSDWTNRFGGTLRALFDAMDTGRSASHDYRKLSAHGVPPQHATEEVFRKHFGKR